MIPLWYMLLLVVLVFGLVLAVAALWFQRQPPAGRSAADPDKETPPPGWRCPSIEDKPANGVPCASCGKTIPDGDTVFMTRTGIWHPTCHRARRLTLWEG